MRRKIEVAALALVFLVGFIGGVLVSVIHGQWLIALCQAGVACTAFPEVWNGLKEVDFFKREKKEEE